MAFGARHVSSELLTGARFERQMGVSGGALRHTLQLGRESVDILQFDTPGRPYPRPLPPDDTAFQHFAIVVSDMELALLELQRTDGWTPISIGGPQRLPHRSGGVTAFKLQDPEGHPLELLAFPEHAVPPHWRERSRDGIFLGIDHSAISVRDTSISRGFYQTLGFSVTARTLNHGEAQANLDRRTETAGRGHRSIPRCIDPTSGIALLSIRGAPRSADVGEQRCGGDAHRIGRRWSEEHHRRRAAAHRPGRSSFASFRVNPPPRIC